MGRPGLLALVCPDNNNHGNPIFTGDIMSEQPTPAAIRAALINRGIFRDDAPKKRGLVPSHVWDVILPQDKELVLHDAAIIDRETGLPELVEAARIGLDFAQRLRADYARNFCQWKEDDKDNIDRIFTALARYEGGTK